MGDKSQIQWTDATWNPVLGCSKVSPGCVGCYAVREVRRLSWNPNRKVSKANAGLVEAHANGQLDWTGIVRLIPERLDQPLRWTRPRRIFVNSLSDLFHESLPDEAIDQVFAVMALARQHTFQILTKRSERMREYLSVDRTILAFERVRLLMDQPSWVSLPSGRSFPRFFDSWPLRNVWLGVSVEDQKTADERVPQLLQTSAAVRSVSYEPALELVDFSRIAPHMNGATDALGGFTKDVSDNMGLPRRYPHPRLNWVIVGGESGPAARPFNIGWAQNVIAQCRANGTACFVKQLGTKPVYQRNQCASPTWEPLPLHDKKGGNWNEWPEDLRVREFPE